MEEATLVQNLQLVYQGEANLNNCLHAESMSSSWQNFIQLGVQFIQNYVEVSAVALSVCNQLVITGFLQSRKDDHLIVVVGLVTFMELFYLLYFDEKLTTFIVHIKLLSES